jgi:hypothetical protein
VKTIFPVNWSEAEGDGIDPLVDDGAGAGEAGLKLGRANGSVTAGAVKPEGVEAWSVANKSGVGVDAAGRLHPEIARSTNAVRNFLFNRFKIKLLTRQNLRAETSAIRAVDLSSLRMIFLEACHALHFGRDATEAELRLFRRCAFAEFDPMGTDRFLIHPGKFTDGESNFLHVHCTRFPYLCKRFFQNGSDGFDVVSMKH